MSSFLMPKKQPVYMPMLGTFGGGSARGFNSDVVENPTPVDVFAANSSLSPSGLLAKFDSSRIIASVYWAAAGESDSLFEATGLATANKYARVAEQMIQTTSDITKYGYWNTSKTIPTIHTLVLYGITTGAVITRLMALRFTSGTPTDWWNYVGLNPALSGVVATTTSDAPIYTINASVYGTDGNLDYSVTGHSWRWSGGAYKGRRTNSGGLFADSRSLKWQHGGSDGDSAGAFDDGGWYLNEGLQSGYFYNADGGSDNYTGSSKTRFNPSSNVSSAGSPTNIWGFLNNDRSDKDAQLYLGATSDAGDAIQNYSKVYGLLLTDSP